MRSGSRMVSPRMRVTLYAALFIVITGCSSGHAANTASHSLTPGSGENSGAQGSLLVPGTVVMVWCPDSATSQGGGRVTLSAISVSTGRTVAMRSVPLPSNATPSQPCTTDGSATADQPTRQMFDRTFTNMAVTVSDPSTQGTLVTAVNIQTGKLMPAAPPQGFASTPRQDHAVFDVTGEDLWYADSVSGEIFSRSLQSGSTVVRGHPSAADAVAVSHGRSWALNFNDDWAVAPDSRHIVASNSSGGMYLAGVGADLSNSIGDIGSSTARAASIGPGLALAGMLPGSGSTNCRAPAEWVDSTRLLCYSPGGNLALMTFSPGLTSVTSWRPDLLPQTNLVNFSPVISPDGRSFAFLSLQGTVVTLYRQALAPGSTPVKIAVVPSSGPSGNVLAPLLLQWN